MVNGTGDGAIASMTGFAAREGAEGDASWSWEIRSVNGRGLDLRFRLPEGLGALEQPLRSLISARIKRGSVTLGLRTTRNAASGPGRIDEAALAAALHGIAQVEDAAQALGVALRPASAADVMGLKGVAEAGDGPALPKPDILLADAEPLLAAFVAMRLAEGAKLAALLSSQIDRIAELTEAASDTLDSRAETQADRLRANMASVLENADALDPTRLAQEVAALAVKFDVTEEIDRLRAHITAARDLLAGGGPVGRKLDFLMQEFNREANTLCSKSGDAALTAIGLDLKLAIDQMREQVQNVE